MKAGLLTRLSRGLFSLAPYRPMEGGRERLDREYATGGWEYLRGLDELPRFSIIAGYCRHLKPTAAILEIGCGEGLLAQRLNLDHVEQYVGVDISAEAVRLAREGARAGQSFVAAEAESYEPEHRFDVIIFNECLEYFDDPIALVRRYETYLNPGGLFILSIFVGQRGRDRQMWRRFSRVYTTVVQAVVTSSPSRSWTVKVFEPSNRATPGVGRGRLAQRLGVAVRKIAGRVPTSSQEPVVLHALHPSATEPGKRFNEQRNGLAALAVSCDHASPSDVIVFGDHVLQTGYRGPSLLTALVPSHLFSEVGIVKVCVRGKQGDSNALDFEVRPSGVEV